MLGSPSEVSSIDDETWQKMSGKPNKVKDHQTCCQSGCLIALFENKELAHRVTELKAATSQGKDGNILKYEMIKKWTSHMANVSAELQGHRQYRAWDMHICEQAACKLLFCPRPSLKKLKTWLAEGNVNPPVDGRTLSLQAMSSAERQAADTGLDHVF